MQFLPKAEEAWPMTEEGSALKLFDELLDTPQNRLVEEAASQGRIPVGYSCSFVPEALLMADRLFPVRLRAPGVAGTELADNYLSTLTCSYTRSILEFAMDNHYDRIQGWVFVPSCAPMQRFIDNFKYLKHPAFCHTLDVPQKITRLTIKWLEEELSQLLEKLSSHFNVDMSKASLLTAIDQWNDFTDKLNAIGNLRKRQHPPLTGTDFHKILTASLASPKDLILPLIETVYSKLNDSPGHGRHRARLMLVGGHLDDPEFIRIIESQGGLVVADRFCTGSMPGLNAVDGGENPIQSLAEHVFRKTHCPRMMENFDLRLQTIRDTIRDFRVDGVIIDIIKFCDLWGVDTMPLISSLRESGIPVLKLEREYRLGGEGQLRTRVQAFIESMGR